MYNDSVPKCGDDPWVENKAACSGNSVLNALAPNVTGGARTDAKLILQEPRDGPQLPFCFEDGFGMGAWRISDTTKVSYLGCSYNSHRECWEKVFLQRLAEPGHGQLLHFVKMFNTGGPLRKMSRRD